MDESKIRDELKKLIQDSSLSAEDKEVWFKALENAPYDILVAVFGFFLGFNDYLHEATIFFKRKIDAAKSGSADDWNAILRDEESFLNGEA